jgi:hypothetical protein
MKKTILACACALLLSTGGVFAQMQPAPGASSEGNVGPGATKSRPSTRIEKGNDDRKHTGKMKAGGPAAVFQHGQCRIRRQKIIRPSSLDACANAVV